MNIKAGDRIQNIIGHWYDVLEVLIPGVLYRVQPLTYVGIELRPFGGPCRMRDYEVKK